MSKFKLEQWEFGEEEVSLYWITSPKNGDENKKYLTAFFKTSNGVKSIKYSWGTLPFLYLGYTYKNGSFLDTNFYNKSGKIKINNSIKQEIGIAYDFIPISLYPFKECKSGGFEYCVRIQSNEETIIVPCIEILRSIYTPTKFLTNRLLTTSGLDDLVTSEMIIDNSIYIEFSEDYPMEYTNDNDVAWFIWLKHAPLVYNIWKSVYNDWIKDKKISIKIPSDGDYQLKYKGISYKDKILALNVELRNLDFPFSKIFYFHPNEHRYDAIENNSEKTKRINSYNDKNEVLIPKDISSNKSAPAFADSLNFYKVFKNPPTIKRGKGNIDKDINKQTYRAIPNNTSPFSAQDWSNNGKARPIEAAPRNDIEPTIPVEGLELFCKTIDIIKRYSLSVEIKFYYLSGNKKFSILKDGSRRQYALAKIKKSNGEIINIIEVARPDDWSLSTLVFSETERADEVSEILTDQLSQNSGHWNQDWFSEFKNISMKPIPHHYDRSPTRWAQLLLE